jgi:hypothetical protein
MNNLAQETSLFDAWKKGGLRYRRLKQRVPEFLSPAKVDAFFVAVRKRGRIPELLNPLSPLQHEYVIAATSDGVSVLRLRRPGVFSATITGIEYEAALDAANIEWREGRLALDGVEYFPIAFHNDDAEQVAELLVR